MKAEGQAHECEEGTNYRRSYRPLFSTMPAQTYYASHIWRGHLTNLFLLQQRLIRRHIPRPGFQTTHRNHPDLSIKLPVVFSSDGIGMVIHVVDER